MLISFSWKIQKRSNNLLITVACASKQRGVNKASLYNILLIFLPALISMLFKRQTSVLFLFEWNALDFIIKAVYTLSARRGDAGSLHESGKVKKLKSPLTRETRVMSLSTNIALVSVLTYLHSLMRLNLTENLFCKEVICG